jgi:hypothetical protein
MIVHGPLDGKVERWTGYPIEVLQQGLEGLSVIDEKGHAREVWILPSQNPLYPYVHVQKSSGLSFQDKEKAKIGYVTVDARSAVDEEAQKAAQLQKAKELKIKRFRSALKERLLQRAETRKKAVKEIVECYHGNLICSASFMRSLYSNDTSQLYIQQKASPPFETPPTKQTKAPQNIFPVSLWPFLIFQKKDAILYYRKSKTRRFICIPSILSRTMRHWVSPHFCHSE